VVYKTTTPEKQYFSYGASEIKFMGVPRNLMAFLT
jgi:hypothetical protein